jgi:hypothetical protein
MRRVVGLSLSLLTLISLSAAPIEAGSSSKSLAIISGIVTDNKGNPLAGALVSLAREGAPKSTVKHTSTDKQGKFIAKVIPGRYGIKANAIGFAEVAFDAVDVRAQQELVYKFNLEPVGYGNTLPERRRDREDVKWTLRNSQTRRSIFQAQEGEDATIRDGNRAGNKIRVRVIEFPKSNSRRSGTVFRQQWILFAIRRSQLRRLHSDLRSG